VKRGLLLAGACIFYACAAWVVRPGFYDGFPAPNYDYVSPPQDVAPFNMLPTSGSGDVSPSGGVVTTHDQPIAQAGITVPAGALASPTHVDIKPFAPPRPASVTLEGNVYCITATATPSAPARVTLLVPPTEPFPTAMYFAADRTGTWSSIGGSVDLSTYLMSASTRSFGCFAVGYPKTKTGPGLDVRGSVLPAVVALLIAVALLGGLPMALRRRYNRPRVR
jgi:hypothetical protein